MSKRMWSTGASAIAVMALLGGCGLGFGDEMIGQTGGPSAGPAVPQAPTATDLGRPVGSGGGTPSGGSGSGTASAPASGSQVASVTEVRDGTWDVGDAGSVEFLVSHGQLQLLAENPAPGWQLDPPINQPTEIEVRFSRAPGTSWTFLAQLSGSTLQITKEKSVTNAPDGTYPVGSAGAVAITTSGSRLGLGAVHPEAGWTVDQKQVAPSSILVAFRQGARLADCSATLSGTQATVTTSEGLSGPVPST